MAQVFDEAMKLMSHSKDRYYTKAQENGLMADEKELMLVISEQIEQIKILKTAFLNVSWWRTLLLNLLSNYLLFRTHRIMKILWRPSLA